METRDDLLTSESARILKNPGEQNSFSNNLAQSIRNAVSSSTSLFEQLTDTDQGSNVHNSTDYATIAEQGITLPILIEDDDVLSDESSEESESEDTEDRIMYLLNVTERGIDNHKMFKNRNRQLEVLNPWSQIENLLQKLEMEDRRKKLRRI